MTVVLSGVVGSTAYGLAREGSDVDRLAVFAAPTVDVAGLDWHPKRESRVTTDPDVTEHEVGKACRLLLGCNPTVTELLWLPNGMYEAWTVTGDRLVGLREAFLSEPAVRNAYGGYAHQQVVRLRDRGDSFSSDTRARTVKHARHLLRLLHQGRGLLTTGRLTVRVQDPGDYFAFDTMSVPDMLAVYDREDAAFRDARSVLPPRPDRGAVAAFLRRARIEHLHPIP